MKSLFSFFAFSIFSLHLFAQAPIRYAPYTGYKYNYEYESETEKGRAQISDNNIKSVTTIRKYSKKNESKTKTEYSKEGYLNTYTQYRKDLPIKKEYTYNEVSKINNIKTYNRKGELTWETKSIYNLDTLITDYQRLRKGKDYQKTVVEYDGRVMKEMNIFFKNMDVPKTRYMYSFYNDGSRKETKYFRKGKLKHTWNYDCNSEGEILKKHKDTATVCHWQDTDSLGRIILWWQTTNEKNQITKTKSVFEKESDKNPVEYYAYNSKNILTLHWRKTDKHYKYFSYKNSGRLARTYELFYDKFGKEIKSVNIYYGGKKNWTSTTEISYNDKGLKSKETTLNSKGKTIVTDYTYEYY